MKCSTTVIKGLIKIRRSLFILSTHLYEIGEELKVYPNILFNYFETAVKDDQLRSSAISWKPGISNDRIGYLILKRGEGRGYVGAVVIMLPNGSECFVERRRETSSRFF